MWHVRLMRTAAVLALLTLVPAALPLANDAPADVQANPVTPLSAVLVQRRLSYDLDAVRRGEDMVPAVFERRLPGWLPAIEDTRERKETFLKLVLPIVLEANSRIHARRLKLLEISWLVRNGIALPPVSQAWLETTARDYKVDLAADGGLDELLRRVDIVPASLALAQAITESGWGSSRFAQKGNALFGQRIWSQGGGIVPKARASEETFEVRAFRSLSQSVREYMRNLNTHDAYADLRALRADLRRTEGRVDGYELAAGLTSYAETGDEYVEVLRTIMQANSLQDFETARIEGTRLPSLAFRAY
ncbi:MAG: glucosaminidase domain-containing protein [Pseudomonadota bacterium]|nr:glucosaminidase domain-containing protein [Pseudomonadota bacterium]